MNRENAEILSQKVVTILKDIRIEKGITKLEISNKTGISRTAITLIENKKNSPTLRTLVMISSCLDIDLTDVIHKAQTMMNTK